jgi:transcriptional repressor NrdR
VLETRLSEDLETTRRRRECVQCTKRFTTYERVEHSPLIVVKKDGRREQFTYEKLLRGLQKATERTRVSADQVEEIVNKVEQELRAQATTEIPSTQIGEYAARHLKKLDKVAYIRFASVFKQFVEVEDFEKELKKLL